MTPPPRRRTALGVLALAAALTTAACGGGTTDPSAAVLLGSQAVPIELVEERTSALLAAAGPEAAENREELQRQVLNRLVLSRLLDRVAEEQGVTVSDAEVEEALRRLAGGVESTEEAYRVAQEQGGLDREAAFRFARDEVLRTRLATELGPEVAEERLRQAYEQRIGEFDTASVRVIPITDPQVAQQTLTELQGDPGRFEELAQERADDPSALAPEPVEVGRGQTPPALDTALFSTPPGGVTLVEEQGVSYVIQVVERNTVPFEEAAPQLREEALGAGAQEALRARLAAEAEEVGVRVNPRFGEWDPATLQVVPDEPETSRPAQGTGGGPLDPGLPPVPGAEVPVPGEPAPR